MPTVRASRPEVNILLATSEEDAQKWIDRHPDLIEIRWMLPREEPDTFRGLVTRAVAVTEAAREDEAAVQAIGWLKSAVANGFLLPRHDTLRWEMK